MKKILLFLVLGASVSPALAQLSGCPSYMSCQSLIQNPYTGQMMPSSAYNYQTGKITPPLDIGSATSRYLANRGSESQTKELKKVEKPGVADNDSALDGLKQEVAEVIRDGSAEIAKNIRQRLLDFHDDPYTTEKQKVSIKESVQLLNKVYPPSTVAASTRNNGER